MCLAEQSVFHLFIVIFLTVQRAVCVLDTWMPQPETHLPDSATKPCKSLFNLLIDTRRFLLSSSTIALKDTAIRSSNPYHNVALYQRAGQKHDFTALHSITKAQLTCHFSFPIPLVLPPEIFCPPLVPPLPPRSP